MQFDWWTFALQVINFLILAWLLQHFLYKPVRKVIERRRADVDAKIEEAEATKNVAEEEKRKLEAANAAFADEKESRLADLHRDLAAERERALKEARAKADELIEQGRRQIESERTDALKALEKEIAALAADMAAKAISARSGEAASIPGRLRDYLSSLSDDDKNKLRRGLDKSGASVKVTTAQPLAEAARGEIKTLLGKAIGANIEIDFDIDDALIDGAELRFPHAAIKLSVADALARLKESALAK